RRRPARGGGSGGGRPGPAAGAAGRGPAARAGQPAGGTSAGGRPPEGRGRDTVKRPRSPPSGQEAGPVWRTQIFQPQALAGAAEQHHSIRARNPRGGGPMPAQPRRIVSLLPSATEIAYALGLGERVCGVTHECDYPPDARTKRVLVQPAFDPSRLTAREIDALVSRLAREGKSVYEVDQAAIQELEPDMIITQTLC